MSLRSKEIRLPDNIVPFSSVPGRRDTFTRPTLALPETYAEPLIKIDTEPALFAITKDDLPLVQKHIELLQAIQKDGEKSILSFPDWYPLDLPAKSHLVLYFSATGGPNKLLAPQIPKEDGETGIAESTIKNRLSDAYEVFGVDTRGGATVEAMRRNFIDPVLFTTSTDTDGYYLLTPRQRQIYTLIAQKGYANKEVADLMCLAESTVKNQLSEAFASLGISQREEIIMYDFVRQRDIVERAEKGPFDLDMQKSTELFNIDIRFSEANKQLYKFFDSLTYPETIATAAFIGCFNLTRETGITNEHLEQVGKLSDDAKNELITIASYLNEDLDASIENCAFLMRTDSDSIWGEIASAQQKLGCETPMQVFTALFYDRLLQYKQRVTQGKRLRKALETDTAALVVGEDSIVLAGETQTPTYRPPIQIRRRVV